MRHARAALGLVALGVAGALALRWLGADYALGQATLVATYAIAGLGVVIIVGQNGQIALGQGAPVALGAYVEAVLALRGVPPLASLPLAIAAGAGAGALASLPARRLGGLYFGISTLACALLVEEALVRWEGVTRGAAGLAVPALAWGDFAATEPGTQLALSLGALALAYAACRRLLASRVGRAWRALREDEAAAAACGIAPAPAKALAFTVGGALAGLAGALYAHWIGFISPEQFGLMFSFELLMLAFIGGAHRLAGALWGALAIVTLPQLIAVARDTLPGGASAGLEQVLFGAAIVAIVMVRLRGPDKQRRP